MKNVRRTRGKVSLDAIADFQNENRGAPNPSAVNEDEYGYDHGDTDGEEV